MVHGENLVNAPNLVPVGLKKEPVNVTALLQHMVEKPALVHHRSQKVVTLTNAQVGTQIFVFLASNLTLRRFFSATL